MTKLKCNWFINVCMLFFSFFFFGGGGGGVRGAPTVNKWLIPLSMYIYLKSTIRVFNLNCFNASYSILITWEMHKKMKPKASAFCWPSTKVKATEYGVKCLWSIVPIRRYNRIWLTSLSLMSKTRALALTDGWTNTASYANPYVTHMGQKLESISRVSNQKGVSPLYIMLEIHHSGREPSIFFKYYSVEKDKERQKKKKLHTPTKLINMNKSVCMWECMHTYVCLSAHSLALTLSRVSICFSGWTFTLLCQLTIKPRFLRNVYRSLMY